jgi:hypothetical protein
MEAGPGGCSGAYKHITVVTVTRKLELVYDGCP